MIYAPVVIPTLCRYEHFKRCIESLSRCTGAEHTEVYIGLDYPAKESHWDGYNKIKDYLEHCGNLGFKELHIVKRPHNYGFGPKGNYISLKNFVLEKFDRIITSEDDNEFSPCFLDYMNKGLELYKDDESVFSISGYNYPIDMSGYEYNVYFSKKFSAWGCGLWKHKEILYMQFYERNTPRKILHSGFIKELLRKDFKKLLSLLIMDKKKVQWGDVYREIYSIYADKYSIFPAISKVKNWGHDGSGVNCGNKYEKMYLSQELDKKPLFEYSTIEKRLDKTLIKRIDRFKRYTMREYFKFFYYGFMFLFSHLKNSDKV